MKKKTKKKTRRKQNNIRYYIIYYYTVKCKKIVMPVTASDSYIDVHSEAII